MKTSIFRYSIGPVKKQGFICLNESIKLIQKIYPSSDVFVCHNQLNSQQLNFLKKIKNIKLINQNELNFKLKPIGVSWKLYPNRIDNQAHEIFIDNDIIIKEKITEIDLFFNQKNHFLILEDEQRAYGQFDKHIKSDVLINSGLFGLPPHANFESFVDYYVNEWQINSGYGHEFSKTFDEQGIMALYLMQQKDKIYISKNTLTKCETKFVEGKGFHFIKLNRKGFHEPFANYFNKYKKIL